MHSLKRRRPGLCASHIASRRSGLYLLTCLLLFCATPASGQGIVALKNQKDALVYERDIIKASPGAFYLIIDLTAQSVALKADGNMLRTCPIQHQAHLTKRHTQIYRFLKRIDPITIEPGNAEHNRRQRLLPLDFHQRLLEGPRHHSRLFFSPHLVLQAPALPRPSIPHIILSTQDIKALGSALRQTHTAIVIPSVPSKKAKP